MASHSHNNLEDELTQLKPGAKTLGIGLMAAGAIALVIALVFTLFIQHQTQRFFFSYLFGIAGFLAISCASLLFLLIHHLVRAGWMTNLRRLSETYAAQLPLLSLLLIPIIGTVIWQKGTVYSWARPTSTPIAEHGGHGGHEEHGGHGHEAAGHEKHDKHDGEKHDAKESHDHAHSKKGDSDHNQGTIGSQDVHAKPTNVQTVSPDGPPASDRNMSQSPKSQGVLPDGGMPAVQYPNEQVRPGVQREFDAIIKEKNNFWLNPIVWSIRIPLYLIIISATAVYFRRCSIRQDATGDIDISTRLMTLAAPLLMATALIVTFIAFDMFMSLDPHWFSTMYGVYFFASGAQAMWALLALTLMVLQKRGYLRGSVGTEHYHDLGKWTWAFIFFFGYIAYSQYMLQWYANLPEETFWYDKRGYSTLRPNGYSPLVLALLFGRVLIPFAGLLSRHVKRSRFGLAFWASWLLVFFFVDIYLLVIPEYAWVDSGHLPPFGVPEILCLLGVGALWFGNSIRMLAGHALRPLRDPRVHESMALQNY